MKPLRIFLFIFLFQFLFTAASITVLGVWQPDALKLFAARAALSYATRSKPYSISVKSVQGDIFKELKFIDATLYSHQPQKKELLHIDQIHIQTKWISLLRSGAGPLDLSVASGEAQFSVSGIVGLRGKEHDINFKLDAPEISDLSYKLRAARGSLKWSGTVKGFTDNLKIASAIGVALKNGFRLNWQADIQGQKKDWIVSWKKNALQTAVPKAGSWTNPALGRLIFTKDGTVNVERFHLTNGREHLKAHGTVGPKGFKNLALDVPQVDLSRAAQFVPSISLSGKSTAKAHVTLNGEWKRPEIQGTLEAEVPSLTFRPVNLTLTNCELFLSQGDSGTQILKFYARSKKGFIAANGQSRFPDLDLKIRAKSIELGPAPAWSARADAELRITGSADSPDLKGNLLIREADYRPAEKSKKKAGKKPPRSPPAAWVQSTVDVELSWPRDVWYRSGDSAIETRGKLYLRKKTNEEQIFPSGEIETVRGNAAHMGKIFKLETGLLTFTGPPAIDPLLNITALHKTDAAEITLRILGTASSPQLELTSNPPMTQQDIISVLVFGVPSSELRLKGEGEKGSTQEKAQKLAGQIISGYLSKKAEEKGLEKLKLDVLNIQPSEKGAEVTVGRYIGRNLFVTLGQTLGASGKRKVSAEYFFTPRFTLLGEVGTEQRSIDLQFRIPLNKPSPLGRP